MEKMVIIISTVSLKQIRKHGCTSLSAIDLIFVPWGEGETRELLEVPLRCCPTQELEVCPLVTAQAALAADFMMTIWLFPDLAEVPSTDLLSGLSPSEISW